MRNLLRIKLQWPARIFADSKALRAGTLRIHAWAERQSPAVQKRFNCMTRENWRERFVRFAQELRGRPAYVTVDMERPRDRNSSQANALRSELTETMRRLGSH